MRKLTILITLLMTVLFTGTVFASEAQEQLIHEQFGTGSYATWLRDDGTWDNGKPGTFQSTKPHEYSIPAEKLKNSKLTRIEVKTGYSFDPENFKKAGGWQRISSYSEYAQEILKYTPDNLAVTDTHDLATGKVNVTWSLRLSPTQPPENKREARETVDLNVREHLRQLGFKLEDDKVYEDFREGWLWCLPVHIQWYGVLEVAPDNNLAVSITSYPEDAQQGEAVTVTGEITSDSETPVTTLVQWYLDSKKVFEGEVTIDKKRNLTFPFTMPNKDTLVTVQVNPGRDKPANEVTWEDNKDKVTIQLATIPAPPASNLTFTAVNQHGYKGTGPKVTRPAGTAKWTDYVTATLKVDPPKPPKGTLKSWSITSATLTYPKKSERFTFGTPYPPVGTRTVNMSTGGHTSTVTFQQDWAMDGARIFSQLEQKLMAEKPKYYPITASYTIKYTYEYQVSHRSCRTTVTGSRSCRTEYETKTGTGTYSDTVTAQLLVNGTGVDSRAQ